MPSIGIRTRPHGPTAEGDARVPGASPTVGKAALPAGLLTAGLIALCVAMPTAVAAQSTDQPVQIGSSDQSLGDLTGENTFPLQITGFGVADYSYDGTSGENSARVLSRAAR